MHQIRSLFLRVTQRRDVNYSEKRREQRDQGGRREENYGTKLRLNPLISNHVFYIILIYSINLLHMLIKL